MYVYIYVYTYIYNPIYVYLYICIYCTCTTCPLICILTAKEMPLSFLCTNMLTNRGSNFPDGLIRQKTKGIGSETINQTTRRTFIASLRNRVSVYAYHILREECE